NVTTSTYTYTTAGQLAAEQVTLTNVPGTFTTSYGYDLGGRLTTIGYPSGRVVQRSYQVSGATAVDRLNTLTDQTTLNTLQQGIHDNAAGQLMSRTLGNSVVETRGYNTRNQLTEIVAARSG